jgi:hypothetical protein
VPTKFDTVSAVFKLQDETERHSLELFKR